MHLYMFIYYRTILFLTNEFVTKIVNLAQKTALVFDRDNFRAGEEVITKKMHCIVNCSTELMKNVWQSI